jgi:hypothetical protein
MQRQAIRLSVAAITFLVGLAANNLLGAFRADARPGDTREVLAVESEYVRAHLERDVEALDRVLADDFSSFGGRVRKGHRLAILADPNFRVVTLETSGVVVTVEGDSARVSGRARLRAGWRGREMDFPTYEFKRRLARRDGRWQIVQMEFAPAW